MKEIKLTQDKIAFVDDEESPRLSLFRWYANHERGRWYVRRQSRHESGKQVGIKLHREIVNAKPGQIVDHINGNGLDNRKENLRICNDSENQRNKRIGSSNKSGYKGVCWISSRGKWKVYVQVDKKRIHLGYFENLIDAALAYNQGAMKHHGVFAKLNQIENV